MCASRCSQSQPAYSAEWLVEMPSPEHREMAEPRRECSTERPLWRSASDGHQIEAAGKAGAIGARQAMDQQWVTTVFEEGNQCKQFFAQRPASERNRKPEVVDVLAADHVKFGDAPGTSSEVTLEVQDGCEPIGLHPSREVVPWPGRTINASRLHDSEIEEQGASAEALQALDRCRRRGGLNHGDRISFLAADGASFLMIHRAAILGKADLPG